MNDINSSTKWYLDKLRKELLGGKIVGTVVDTESNSWDQFFGLQVKMPGGNTKAVWFLQDDEANGAGSFDIVDIAEVL